jgi:hypothetical protein
MLRRLLDVRPEERRPTAIAFLVLFGILAAHTILRNRARRAVPRAAASVAAPVDVSRHGRDRGRAVAVDRTQTDRPSRARDPPGLVRRRDPRREPGVVDAAGPSAPGRDWRRDRRRADCGLLLKGADGVLRPSLNRMGMELLFVPIPDQLRSFAKLTDVLGQRGGQALASLFILGRLARGGGDTTFAIVSALLCMVWVPGR